MKSVSCHLCMITLAAAALLAGGCARAGVTALAPAITPAPEPAGYGSTEGRLAILEPEMFLYDVSAGGIFEYREDWSGRASKRVMVSAALKLAGMGYGSVILPDAVKPQEFFKLKTKMRYHSSAFQGAFFTNTDLASELDNLTYSVGPQHDLCEAFGVDGFLYIYGFEENFSKERREITGPAARERTFMAAMLIEKDGRVSWYRHMMVSGGLDMRKEKDAYRMVGAMFE